MSEDREFLKARAVRLGYLLQSPGWPDLLALLRELEHEAVEAVNKFEGWDREKAADLVTIQRTVSRTCEQIVKRVSENIVAGQVDDVLQNVSVDSRQLSDEELQQLAESRIPGTY
jgi:DNA primase large subunit